MTQLFDRRCRLTIDTLEIENLAIQFNVTKNLKAEPNHAKITVRNLSPDHRKVLEGKATLECKLEAGYRESMFVIYSGTVRTAHTERDDAEFVTTIETGDGDHEIAGSRLGLQIPAKATPQQLIELVGQAIGVGLGNLPQALAGLNGGIGPATTIQGSASEAMTQYCRSYGLEWSVQDGALQVMKIGQAASDRAALLSPSSGLVGSPSVDNKGVVSAKCLIQPDVLPGRLVAIESIGTKGVYRVEEVTFSGDTHAAQPWYIDLHARKF